MKNKQKMRNKKKIVVAVGIFVVLFGLITFGTTSLAEESVSIKSKGAIRYQDRSGTEVVFDAGDLEMLFQSAAKGKNGYIQALSGIGTSLTKNEEKWNYSRNPATDKTIPVLQSKDALAAMPFMFLHEALADSQKLPETYADTYSLATSDNLTIGNAAWADGSLLLGNNHDLLEAYAKGWMEGAGYTAMLPIKDANGNVVGYVFE